MQSAFEAIYKELDGIYNKAETIYSVWASEVARREVVTIHPGAIDSKFM